MYICNIYIRIIYLDLLGAAYLSTSSFKKWQRLTRTFDDKKIEIRDNHEGREGGGSLGDRGTEGEIEGNDGGGRIERWGEGLDIGARGNNGNTQKNIISLSRRVEGAVKISRLPRSRERIRSIVYVSSCRGPAA